jgi:hypothetical protein
MFMRRLEHRVQRTCQAAKLVVAAEPNPLTEIARGRDALGRHGELGDRADRGARDEPAEQGREPDPARADTRQHEREPAQRRVDAVQRARRLHCDAPLERGRDHARVYSVDFAVRTQTAQGALRDRAVASGHVERDRIAIDRLDRPAVGEDELRVAARVLQPPLRWQHRLDIGLAAGFRVVAARASLSALDHLGGQRVQLAIDPGPQVVAHHSVGHARGHQHGHRHGDRRQQNEAAPERHGARRM